MKRSLGLVVLGSALSLASALPASAEMKDVVLHLQKRVTMQELAASVTDPASPRYHKYYTPEEIRQLAAPSDAEYSALIQKLHQDGAQVLAESKSHLILRVRAERTYLEGLDRETGLLSTVRSFLSPSIVDHVTGLTNSVKRRPRLKFLPFDGDAKAQFTGLTPAQIHKAYGFDTIYGQGINAKGQDIAIATYDGFQIDDINSYYQQNEVSPAPIVNQVIFNGTPNFDPGSAAETQTDAEFSGMIAPGANIHIYASATNDSPGELALFTKILDDNVSKIVNYSWGACEKDVDPSHRSDMDGVFARAVAQGVNVFVATGDSGSDCEGDGSTVADFPADEPNVVAVGGTTLALDSRGDGSETAWSGSGSDGGSGGGVSTLYQAPSFQSGLPSAYQSGRAYPDVAFNANPKSGQPTWIHYDPTNPSTTPADAQYVVIGGTSIAAPQWAGFLALVNAARAAKGPIGYIDPIMYAAAASNQASYFNDVTSGNNGAYTAAAGWDAVTGWGSMKADQLLTFLVTQ